MRHVGVGALDGLLQPRKLQRLEVRARHGFGGRIEHRERLIGSCEVAPGNGRGYSINRQEHSNESAAMTDTLSHGAVAPADIEQWLKSEPAASGDFAADGASFAKFWSRASQLLGSPAAARATAGR